MNLKNFAVVTATAMFLLAAFSFNSMTAYAQEGSNMTNMTGAQTPKAIIHITPEHENAQQIRDEIRSNHPLLAAVSDKIETMDAQETLKYTIGLEIVSDLLKMHALDLITNQTGGK
jgi:hypothetical protein